MSKFFTVLPLAGILAVLPLLGAEAGNPVAGQKVFETNCGVCHGPSGDPVAPGTPSFIKGERMDKPDPVLLTSIRNGLNVMPAWKGALSEQDIGDALAFIRTLRR